MGGYGSGRTGGFGRGHSFIGERLALDMRRLNQLPAVLLGQESTLQWEDGNRVSLRFHPDMTALTVSYVVTRKREGGAPEGPPEAVTLDIALDETPCRFGNARLWFLCPRCRRRAVVLYLSERGDRFHCRTCSPGLCYRSQWQTPHQKLEGRLLT